MFRSVIDAGKDALRAILIVNGGAILALLALMGNLEEKLISLLDKGLITALCMFSVGILFATVVYGTRYLSQAYYSENKSKVGDAFTAFCVCLAVLSYFSLGFGLYKTFIAFNSLI